MPDPSLSAALAEAYASAPVDEIVYHTLMISNPMFSQPIYVVQDNRDLQARLETGELVNFVAYSFNLTKPEVSPTGEPQCTFEIDNVSREILYYIEQALADPEQSPITVTYREYLSSDLTAPQNIPPLSLTLSNISADVFRIRATAKFLDMTNKRFPSEEFTAERFPGLVAQ